MNTKIVLPNVADIVGMLKPGQTYSLTELRELTDVKTSHLRSLLAEAEKKALRASIFRKRGAWTWPVETASASTLCVTPPHVELKGYEMQLRTFRALCEASRSR